MRIVANINKSVVLLVCILGLLAVIVTAIIAPDRTRAQSTTLPHTFKNGQVADADEVNANFEFLLNEIVSLKDQLASSENNRRELESTVTQLQRTVTSLQQGVGVLTGRVNQLETTCCNDITEEQKKILSYMRLIEKVTGNDFLPASLPLIQLVGANLQILNGLKTDSANGLGNLIIGYQEPDVGGDPNIRTGSHNLIVGRENSYSSYGGIVAGVENRIMAPFACVTGGAGNTASGESSSVTGGNLNKTLALYSSVNGGGENIARNKGDSVNGGFQNDTGGNSEYATVNGGTANHAGSPYSSVGGGKGNFALGNWSTVTGGCGIAVQNFCGVAP